MLPAAAERSELCDLFLEVGEHAPTLNAGWDAGDLAAHLVVRDRRPDAAIGLVIPPLRAYTAKLEKAERDTTPFAELVEKVRVGPASYLPMGWPFVKERANVMEYFIHHEDVLRAQPGWRPRALPDELNHALWNTVRLMAPLMLRGIKDTRITLETPEGAQRSVGRAESKHQVTITAPAAELVLYLSGRRAAAQVRITGSQAGQARLAAATLGL